MWGDSGRCLSQVTGSGQRHRALAGVYGACGTTMTLKSISGILMFLFCMS